MGGTVGIESPAASLPGPGGSGSTFHLWLPLRRVAGPEISAAFPESAGRHVLIVDDEEYNRVVAAGLARELGYEPLTASHAADALDIARRQPLEVIFIDLELPGTKGDELARELRQLPHGERPLLVAMTGQDSEEVRRRCREAGMEGFVLKPFDAGEVRELIGRVRADRASEGGGGNGTPAGPEGAPPGLKAFELYAKGADQSVEFALQKFLHALDEETARLGAAFAAGDRPAVAGAAHRLRTLAALVADRSLNALSARLQDSAAALTAPGLDGLVNEILGATRKLKAELTR